MQVVDGGIYMNKNTGDIYLASIHTQSFWPFNVQQFVTFTFDGGWGIDMKTYGYRKNGLENFLNKLFYIGLL